MTAKNQRLTLVVVVLVVLAGAGIFWSLNRGAPAPGASATQPPNALYTCGMHPQIIRDHPGNCPICGMPLTRMRSEPVAAATGTGIPPGERRIKYYKSTMNPGEISQKRGKDSMGMDLVPVYEEPTPAAQSSVIAIDPVTRQDMGLRTGVVTRGPLERLVRTVAVVDYNESGLADVTTKFKGWIERLYVSTTGAQVHRGDPLFAIYSPELYSAEVEYLLVQEAAGSPSPTGVDALKTSARLKLKYWDISDEQIAELEKTGQPRKTLQVLAPIDGFVIEKNVVDGQMVEAGMRIYRLADLGLVWVQGEVYEQDLPYLHLGQEAVVSLSYLPDRKFRGRVTYIYPYLDERTRTVRVRMEFHNPGYFLKPGMFASVELHARLDPSTLLVPDMAVLRSGELNTVFVALEGGRFEPRAVVLGPRAENDMDQVLSGLRAGERVVTSGQFLLDSESQLREAIQKMIEPANESKLAAPKTSGVTESAGPPAATPGAEAVVYVCPMPEHVSIEYDHPGKCPVCGMALVPVTKRVLEKIQPGGRVLYYTCPMPEHGDVHEAKPGTCPKCGMTLIPVMSVPTVPDAKATRPKAASVPALYTCPMPEHADVAADRPGRCPRCGMGLVSTTTVAHGKIAEENWREQHPAGP